MVNQTVDFIMSRRSVRAYRPEQVEEEKLNAILEAAKFAPNAGGRQLWHFTVVQNKKLMDKMVGDMVDIMSKSNNIHHQQKAADPNYHTFYHAPTIIIVSGAENTMMIETDCAAATENMLIAAESLGLNSCWIGSAELVLSKEDIKKTLGIPEGYKSLYAVSLGYNAIGDKVKPIPRKENIINYVR